MTRIFAPLAVVAMLLVTGALGLGLGLRAYDIRDRHDPNGQSWATGHRLSAIGSLLVVVLLHSIAATYFIGTSRWCREVVDAYKLDVALARRSNSLKRRSFLLAFIGMLAAVAMGASGAANDPGAGLRLQPPVPMTWTQIHLAAAVCFMAFTVWAFGRAWLNMAAHQEIIGRILADVKRIRAERGLVD